MIYGYARVSSTTQGRYGNGLTEQLEALRSAGCEKIYQDAFTGMRMERPGFSKLLTELKSGDTLVVTKLDRFARNASGGAKVIRELVDKGVEVNVLNMGRANNTPMGKLMITILLAFAEFERDAIVERTTEGKAICRATRKGWREGRKPKEIPEFEKFLEKQKEGELTVEECCEALGISRSTWYGRRREIA